MKIIQNLLEKIRAICNKLANEYHFSDDAYSNEVEALCGGELSIEKYLILTHIIEDFEEKPEVIIQLLCERYGYKIPEDDKEFLKKYEAFVEGEKKHRKCD